MASKKASSIEEQIEDKVKELLKESKTKYYTKTEGINSEIDNALKKYPSKKGKDGGNEPDIKVFIETVKNKQIPVMIEAKGSKGDYGKFNSDGTIEMFTKEGKPKYSNIEKFAVNGAIHYANAVLSESTYKEVLAVAINGYDEAGRKFDVGIFYLSKGNLGFPLKIYEKLGGEKLDVSLLYKANWDKLLKLIDEKNLSDEEREKIAKESETKIDDALLALNQFTHGKLDIEEKYRIPLFTGMIMAGLGTDGVQPLTLDGLESNNSIVNNDGEVILRAVKSFLGNSKIPVEKQNTIYSNLKTVFVNDDFWKPENGESKLKKLYKGISENILPLLDTNEGIYIDFTGRLFNKLTDWVRVEGDEKNDVVLTPRYITKFMAQLCKVDKDSYVWDYAAGTGGFLVSAMQLMLIDAKKKITNPVELEKKNRQIRMEQLLGIESRMDMYFLAVLNMILMRDGSANLIKGDSLDFDGKYQQGEKKGTKFNANVFLLNPPYSAKGKGLIFVEKALDKMTHGRAAVIIQENAGSDQGEGYSAKILEKNTLLASIHIPNVFYGKSSVQPAIYVFEVGVPHDKNKEVLFIDMGEDGYKRQNRRKSKKDVNLKDDGTVRERYQEVLDIVNGNRTTRKYYKDNEKVFRDVISLDGNDWTVNQHKKIDIKPTLEDFKKTVSDYLAWEVSNIIKQQGADEGLGK